MWHNAADLCLSLCHRPTIYLSLQVSRMTEHLEERISERFTKKLNQPNQRGYHIGCHQRGTQGVGKNGYSVATLMGNWCEEQADARYSDRRPHLVSDEEKKIQSSRVGVGATVGGALRERKGRFCADQVTMSELLNKEKTVFPGQQPVKGGLVPNPEWATETSRSFINPKDTVVPPKERFQGKSLSPTDRDLAIISKVRKMLIEQGGHEGFRRIRRMLASMDFNGNGQLSLEELKEGLRDYGAHLSDEEAAIVFAYFDRDKSGEVSITELLDGIRGQMNNRRLTLVRQAYRQLCHVFPSGPTLQDLVGICDIAAHPLVTHYGADPEDLRQEFESTWDFISPECEVSLEQFQSYYTDISSGISDEQYFELMIRNTWHLSGGQGSAMNTSCLRVRVTHKNGQQTIEEVKNDLGIQKTDMDAIRKNLADQGITSAVKIEVDY
eukprot:TRINITY_DN524_c0_g4_i1.p1 TRINITY_DN524_c0_g4~~TRINITY_DN524_c0_g4_i1.p1  ORF type:complete len:439 (+),score=113.00 TRINITY_DN524_c0_g4_i1:501-1817(+)